jgi:thiamine-monophosphate kinase
MIGERETIELFYKFFKDSPYSTTPFGDDVSTIKIKGRLVAVLKVDMFVRETDAVPGMSLMQMGHKAVVSTVSDFACKGIQPLALLSSIALPPGTSRSEVSELASGLSSAAEEYGTYIIGGDTNQASDIIIDIAGFGILEGKIMLRTGAKPGDILATTGPFGNTAASFKTLLKGLDPPAKLKEKLLKSVYEPKAHLKLGLALRNSMCVTSSIDSSDGLAWCIHELSKGSRVGFQLTSIPMDEGLLRFTELFQLDPYHLALYGGEEYNIVLTVKENLWEKAVEAVEKAGGRLYKMGKAVKNPGVYLLTDEGERKVQPIGWDLLKDNRNS